MSDAVRLALGTFTAVRVVPPTRVDATVVRRALLLTPLVGAGLGAVAGTTLEAVRQLTHHSVAGVWLASLLAVASMAVGSRALHLDGLADTADGLGSGRDAPGALEVMRRSDIGPFGVVTVVLVVLVQVFATAEAVGRGTGWLSLVVAGVAGRACVVWGCRAGVPAARADGLGLRFAGAFTARAAAAVTLVSAVACAALAWLDDDRSGWLSLRCAVAVLAAAVVAGLLVARCRRRLGGVTGDVLGACVESGTAAALLCFALV